MNITFYILLYFICGVLHGIITWILRRDNIFDGIRYARNIALKFGVCPLSEEAVMWIIMVITIILWPVDLIEFFVREFRG